MSALNDTLSSSAANDSVYEKNGQSAGQFAASLITAIVVFAVQVVLFLLIKDRFARIYQPRTYLVPPRERTEPSAPGWFKWIKPVLSTSNSEFVQKCGLDAYFFLRYLRTLLKIFVPAAFVILPVLIPMNAVDGRGADWQLTHSTSANVTGLDQLAWGNVRPANYHRYWAHWILALLLIIWVCYVAFDELKNYIRMRQAYITSPQHRLRASATTVLVSSIPQKWCTVEALDGLYDVFPGGLRNIWVNRNYDELNDKVSQRDKLAQKLEGAETDLIQKCYKKNEGNISKAEKEAGKTITKEEKKRSDQVKNEKGRRQAEGKGITSGDPHQVKHTVSEALGENGPNRSSSPSDDGGEDEQPMDQREKHGLGEGIYAVTHGIGKVGRGLVGGIRGINKGINNTIDTTNGFMADDRTVTDRDQVSGHNRVSHEEQYSIRPSDHGRLHNQKTFGTTHSAHAHDASAHNRENEPSESLRLPPSMDNDQRPLNELSPSSHESTFAEKAVTLKPPPTAFQRFKKMLGMGADEEEPREHVDYPSAFNEDFADDAKDAVWKKYLTEKDRKTHRLPIFGWQWMPALPLVGEKVDTIYYCRKELARLNTEIEFDQAHPERFPLMNSAFIQFNHQVAAHMACQALSHHLPKQMAPRLVEIDPNDVIWENMSVPWWSSYIRTFGVITVVIAMIVLWAIPVGFTSALSQLHTAAASYSFLHWVLALPNTFITIVQGVLPTILLSLLMFLLPVILRLLSKLQGTQSGMLVELSVQRYYFFFLFVQLFLIVTISSAATTFLSYFTTASGWTNIPNLLGQNIPKASNYFFSYMLLQALSVSAGALVQVGSLIGWFILAPLFDNTARAKFKRQTSLTDIQWGTFFPVYTNLACIGLIYSVISPLILIFNIITFTLFWFVYRFNTLYVTRFTRDTGGLLYPNAINYTFVGVYVAEVALIGLFFLVRDSAGNVACSGQAIGMIVILILTAGYQILLNNAFSPLFRYLPITLEDDAVRRDEEFALALRSRHGDLGGNESEDEDIEDQLENNERRSLEEDHDAQEIEMRQIESQKNTAPRRTKTFEGRELGPYEFQNPEISMDLDRESKGIAITRKMAQKTSQAVHLSVPSGTGSRRKSSSWADRNNEKNRRSSHFGESYAGSQDLASSRDNTEDHRHRRRLNLRKETTREKAERNVFDQINNFNPLMGDQKDVEAQRAARNQLAEALFSGISDELEDLTPDQRDALVQRAFQHSALRARRPVIWLPRDELGVSDDEVKRMGDFSKNIWVSNIRQGLDSRGRCVYSGSPPDFSEVDLIRL